jgi:hypothetical protein
VDQTATTPTFMKEQKEFRACQAHPEKLVIDQGSAGIEGIGPYFIMLASAFSTRNSGLKLHFIGSPRLSYRYENINISDLLTISFLWERECYHYPTY